MSHPFFNTSLRRDPSQPRDLVARIDTEIAERIEEAVDFVCLEVLVESRRARGQPAPVADSESDRAEFNARVEAFLQQLYDDLTGDLGAEQKATIASLNAEPSADRVRRLISAQVALAKILPDYWQRFEAVRAHYAEAQIALRGERPGLLRRIFGR